MIDFQSRKFSSLNFSEGSLDWKNRETEFKTHSERIKNDLAESKTNFFYLGVHLIDMWRTESYTAITCKWKHDDFRKHYGENSLPVGAGNCCSAFFFAFCEEEYHLDKTQVSRLMNIVDEFGDALRGFKEQWKPYSYSQLSEMLSLSEDERKLITPKWTIREIREFKKKRVATSQQLEMDISDPEEPPSKYSRFEKWTKSELCDKIFELEAERDNLLVELERLRVESFNGNAEEEAA